MRKLTSFILIAVLSLSFIGLSTISISAEHDHGKTPKYKEVKLTDEQTEELKVLYEDLVNQRKGIINKYLEFGVLTEEDATKIKGHLDTFYEKMEEDRFIPKWEKHHKKTAE
ncbi:YckD family protein [Aquibacillus rhizosphaerae]|uniref:YckD family protein n=1 Tax=Aquibacillus rhizosphaerae TaxID=3051431 RepID=A0ABT7L340_9BACI|nr:YckD family protein [Aquibacillus sp. LR5S19]MDL4839016.1 YckD family protein [Aquibacillus sp. LR5S19]